MASSLASATVSDPVLRIALWIAISSSLLALLLLLVLIVLRLWQGWRLRKHARFILHWRPLMMQSILGEKTSIPRLAEHNQKSFLILWNEFRESLRGTSESGLNNLAFAVHADQIARHFLAFGGTAMRMLGLMTLGRLRHPTDYERILQSVRKKDTDISLHAARALIMMDPMRAVRDLLPLILQRSDWPSAKIVTILGEAGADTLSPILAIFFRRVPEIALPRMLPLLAKAHIETAAPILNNVLMQAKENELIISALKLIRTKPRTNVVHRFLHHADWRVRTQAASALGRFGSLQDMDLLVPLLSDREWWVRYRAGQALISLPGSCEANLRVLYSSLKDRFARDMLLFTASEAGFNLHVPDPIKT